MQIDFALALQLAADERHQAFQPRAAIPLGLHLGKSIDYYSGGSRQRATAVAGDQLNWKTNRGRSDFDRRHRFVYSFVYDLPKLESDSEVVRALVPTTGRSRGILTFQTGLPFSVIDKPDNNIIQRANLRPGFSGGIEGSGDAPTGSARISTRALSSSRARSSPAQPRDRQQSGL